MSDAHHSLGNICHLGPDHFNAGGIPVTASSLSSPRPAERLHPDFPVALDSQSAAGYYLSCLQSPQSPDSVDELSALLLSQDIDMRASLALGSERRSSFDVPEYMGCATPASPGHFRNPSAPTLGNNVDYNFLLRLYNESFAACLQGRSLANLQTCSLGSPLLQSPHSESITHSLSGSPNKHHSLYKVLIQHVCSLAGCLNLHEIIRCLTCTYVIALS